MRNVAVIVGSLREDSINRKIAGVLAELAPRTLALEILEIGDLPLCNQDDDWRPNAATVAFRAGVKAAEAVLFVTPEYNRSIPSPLKNALDVGSRPAGQSVWAGKAGAVVSASPSPLGAFGANQHLRQSLAALDVRTLAQPDMFLGRADKMFDARGQLIDESSRLLMRLFLHSFEDWIELMAAR